MSHPLLDTDRIDDPPDPFRGNDALYEVTHRACGEDPDERYPSMNDFYTAWQEAPTH